MANRQDVLAAVFTKVLRERSHGDIAFGTIEVSPKTFGDYLLLIEQMLARAKAKFVRCGSGKAGLENGTDIVKIAALAIRYMEECQQAGVNVSRFSELDIKVDRDILARSVGLVTAENHSRAIEAAADRIREIADKALEVIEAAEKQLQAGNVATGNGEANSGINWGQVVESPIAFYGSGKSLEFRGPENPAKFQVVSDPETGLAIQCTEETTGCTDVSPESPDSVPGISIDDL